MWRRLFLVLLFSLFTFCCDVLNAQTFTQLDWSVLRIDSVLPMYTEVVPLETDYRRNDYTVRIAYPEWKALTAAETAVARRYDALLADTLRVESHVGVSRREGFIDIAFVPIVKRDGGYAKLVSCKIEIIPISTPWGGVGGGPKRKGTALDDLSSRYASSSVLSSGRWVRIGITSDGIYRLTNSALRSMGFASPANIRVYGYGGHLLPEVLTGEEWDDLEEVPLLSVADGFLFYANGLEDTDGGRHVVNHYARMASYFVTEANSPATQSAATPIEPLHSSTTEPITLTSATVFTAVAWNNPEDYAWFSGGRQLFEGYDYANGNTRQYTLTLPARPASTVNEAALTVAFSAAADTRTEVSTTFNGTDAGKFSISSLANYCSAMLGRSTFTVDAPLMTNTVRVSTTRGNSGRLNYLALSYKAVAAISADIPMVHFEMPATDEPQSIAVEAAAGQTPMLWRLPEPGLPGGSLAVATSSGGVVSFEADGGDGASHRYVVFDAQRNDYPEPAVLGAVDNQDLHSMTPIDMLIITPASGIFDTEAERLAEEHRSRDGLRVAVVRADKIYNEFSSGTPDATAYRRFLKMLYDRAATTDDAPRYLLLFGDCAWDNRMYTVAWGTDDPDNFLLCFESENSTSDTQCYVMEDYFGLLDDGEGSTLTDDKVDVGVGRFPVRTVSDARMLVDKTISYMRGEQVGAWKNVVAILGDDGTKETDQNIHMEYADDVAKIITAANPEVEVRKFMWDSYPRIATTTGYRYPLAHQAIVKQVEEGALMFNYTGHAATYCLSHEQVLRIEDFAEFNAPRPALWVTAACDVMPFDTQKDNIGETAILNRTGVAVAFYGTARTVYAQNNLRMNRLFCRAVLGQDESGRPNRLGDAVRQAKVGLITQGLETGNRENKLHYALLGDPALRLGSVENRVVVDSIDGKAVQALPEGFTIHAGSRVRFSGHLADADGQQLTNFVGTVSAHLYDSQSRITCRNNSGLPSAFVYSAYDKLLYSGTDSVADGRFTITCPLPIDIKYSDEEGRLVLFAVSNDRMTEANGCCEAFDVGGTAPALDDTKGPDIKAYLDYDTFTDGDRVGATPYFVALLSDESGINYSGNAMGHDLELVIDNNPATTYTLNDYFTGVFGDYSSGSVAFSIPTLNAGPHSLLFRAWDLLNNYSTAELSFVVDPDIKTNILNLTATKSPATTDTQFLLSYDRPGSMCEFTVEVFDFNGRLLWTHTEQGSSSNGLYAITWNLTTGSGMPLGSGIYLYRATVSCDGGRTSSKTKKIVVNRRKNDN